MSRVIKETDAKISVFQLMGRSYLQIDRGGAWITVDLNKVKEDVDQRLINCGFSTKEECDKYEWPILKGKP